MSEQRCWVDIASSAAAAGPSTAQLEVVRQARAADGSVDAMLALARHCGAVVPMYGAGGTARRWELLATIAAEDVSAARIVEAHLDALAVLVEAKQTPVFDSADLAEIGVSGGSTWGVFAAEASGVKLAAVRQRGGGWRLTGVKPWCSLAGVLTHALVTAHTPSGRRLFAVALQDGAVSSTDQKWVARGLQRVPSTSVEFLGSAAVPVGPDQWYLDRPGFAWGGAGVAACWFGGAVGVARHVFASSGTRAPDQIANLHLGAIDVALTGVRSMLLVAARQIDDRRAGGEAGAIMALRVRAAGAAAVEEVLQRSAHALGPAPLALDDRYARRVADLQMYVRQHHAEHDLAALGRSLRTQCAPW